MGLIKYSYYERRPLIMFPYLITLNYLMITFTGVSFFKDITPVVITVSPAFSPDNIKREASVLVVV